jgi:3-oxoacyl-[acyl-carrier-protein] synthase II
MELKPEIVITGLGVISPVGVGQDAFWNSLLEGRSGVRRLSWFNDAELPCPLGAEVLDFEAAKYVRPRKNLKVMSRDIQLGVAAAEMAFAQSTLTKDAVDPDRFGVIYGADMIAADLGELVPAYQACLEEGKFDFAKWGTDALSDLFPLWMLKYLPNMPACHIAISRDARGPNNSLTMGEVSSLAALSEAIGVLSRGHADVMIAGGASSRIHPMVFLRNMSRQVSHRGDDPAKACRPFDAGRDGLVYGEGAAAFLLETRSHAEARGAKILGRVLSCASVYEPHAKTAAVQGRGVYRAIQQALAQARLKPDQIGHVNAHGLGTTVDDSIEAKAIRESLGNVPVTAPKSYFGNLGAAAGAVELAFSLLALAHGKLPPTLNYEHPDPACPVQVVCGQPATIDKPTALVLNHNMSGQAIAMGIAAA